VPARKTTKKSSSEAEADSSGLLFLLADIRAAVGDPNGKLMQPELVDRCRRMRVALEKLRDCDWVITLPDRMDAVRLIAREALEERLTT
jgi:hypothetical protein